MTTRPFIIDLTRNLAGGLRLAIFLPVTIRHFRLSQWQLISFLLLGLLLDVSGDWLSATPPVQFNNYGISHLLALYAINLLSLYIIALAYRQPDSFSPLVTLQYASYPLVAIISLVMALPAFEVQTFAGALSIMALLLGWSLLILLRILRLLLPRTPARHVLALLFYAVFNLAAVFSLPEQPLWYGNVSEADSAYLKTVNVENTYYQQPELMEDALHFIEPGKPGIEEFFFLGFAPDARQDVFIRESRDVQEIVDRRLGTSQRSLLLASHLDTYREQPLANSHNLQVALNAYGRKMDPEDVLVLFLTSHGSKTYELSVEFARMQFNYLSAKKLSDMLHSSSIGWRVIVISACYSGGFIDHLQDPQTLVITAAARDRQSAGCTADSDATWFTDAYFRQALPQAQSFIDAFEIARQQVRLREQQNNEELSNPQMFIGEAIQHKLASIPLN